MGEIKSRRVGAVVEVTIANPQQLNAFDGEMLAQFVDMLEAFEADETVRALVLTGEGRAFSTGAIVSGDMSTGKPITQERMRGGINRAIERLRSSPVPSVVAVNGPAAGGGVGLALAGDIVLVARAAYFYLSFVNVGLSLDCGVSMFVQQAIGAARARALALLGERLDAETAAAWGLVWKMTESEVLLEEAHAIAARLAAGPPLAIGMIKQALEFGWSAELNEGLEKEIELQAKAFLTEDLAEGVRAFREKRSPQFTGR
jgi:2-(1,2-epoxy-1,2-dihydrophenyl)acetyl-CoA isomerase